MYKAQFLEDRILIRTIFALLRCLAQRKTTETYVTELITYSYVVLIIDIFWFVHFLFAPIKIEN